METVALIIGLVVVFMLYQIAKQIAAIHDMLNDRLPPDPDDQVPDEDDDR